MHHKHRDQVSLDGRARKLYRIETGDYVAEAIGEDMQAAIVAAFKKRPPDNPGLVTGAITEGEDWLYIPTEEMLRRAGYDVSELVKARRS
jgi:hypothetical protein